MDSQTTEIILNGPQSKFLRSSAREVFMIGGLGMGKSFILAAVALSKYLSKPGFVVFIGAPTVKMLRSSTIRQLQKAWAKMDYFEGEDYVINRRPPAEWGVRPFSSLSSNKILTTRDGAYAVIDGLDNFESQRGTEFDAIFVDEFRDVDPAAREVLLGRLRGQAAMEYGVPYQAYYVTTPPNNPFTIKQMIESGGQDLEVIWGTSYDNQQNLPPGYIEGLKASYDDKMFEREVLGQLIFTNNSVFMYAFDKDKHVGVASYDPRQVVYLSFDFNVNPMTCLAIQASGAHVKVVREFRKENTDIYEFLGEIKSFIYNAADVHITGDATGQSRQLLLRNNASAYKVISSELGVPTHKFKIAASNTTHENSLVICNSLISRHIHLTIDASCKYLIQDLEVAQYVNDKIVCPKADQGHLLDCFRYYLHNYWGYIILRNQERPY